MKIKFSQNDFDETIKIAELVKKIEELDSEYVKKSFDEIYNKQPFFLTVLLGYRLDISPEELEEVIKIFFLTWEYFKINSNVQTNKVTAGYFEDIQKRNIQMLEYSKGEPTQNKREIIYWSDLQNHKSQSLLAAILHRYDSIPVLVKMNQDKKGIILIGIKSFIQCFEKI